MKPNRRTHKPSTVVFEFDTLRVDSLRSGSFTVQKKSVEVAKAKIATFEQTVIEHVNMFKAESKQRRIDSCSITNLFKTEGEPER